MCVDEFYAKAECTSTFGPRQWPFRRMQNANDADMPGECDRATTNSVYTVQSVGI